MKKIINLTLSALAVFLLTPQFTSCSDEVDPPLEESYELKVDTEKIIFGNKGGNTVLKVETDAPEWTASAKQSWVKVEPDTKNGTISITVEPFGEIGSRSADISVGGKGIVTVSVPLVQNDTEVDDRIISFSEPQALFLSEGGSKLIEVKCTLDWDFDYDDGKWYSVVREDEGLRITTQPQTGPDFLEFDRITVTVGDLTTTTLTVAQTSGNYILMTDVSELRISDENEEHIVEVISTLDWDFWLADPFFYGRWLDDTDRIDETHIAVRADRNMLSSGRMSYFVIMDVPGRKYSVQVDVHQQPDKEVDPYYLAVPDTELWWGFFEEIYAFRVSTIDPDYTVKLGPNSNWLTLSPTTDPYIWTLNCNMNMGAERVATVILSREGGDDVVITVHQSENKYPKPSTYFGETMYSMIGEFEVKAAKADGQTITKTLTTEMSYSRIYNAEPLVKINSFFDDNYIIGTCYGEWINHSGENMMVILTGKPTGTIYTEKWISPEEFDVWYAWCVGTGDDMEILGPDVYVPWTMDRENKTFSYNATYTGPGKHNGSPLKLGVFAYSRENRDGEPYKQLKEPIGDITFKLIRNITSPEF